MLRLTQVLTLSGLILFHVMIVTNVFLAVSDKFRSARAEKIRKQIIALLLMHGDEGLTQKTIKLTHGMKDLDRLNKIYLDIKTILNVKKGEK